MAVIDDFPKRLKETRERKNISKAEINRKTGISNPTLYSYENDCLAKRKIPKLDNARLLAETLGVSIDYLCGLTDNYNDYYESTVNAFMKILTECQPTIDLDGEYPKLIFDSEITSSNDRNAIRYFLTEYSNIMKIQQDGNLDNNMLKPFNDKLTSKFACLPKLKDYKNE